jgi:hypothetical protein
MLILARHAPTLYGLLKVKNIGRLQVVESVREENINVIKSILDDDEVEELEYCIRCTSNAEELVITEFGMLEHVLKEYNLTRKQVEEEMLGETVDKKRKSHSSNGKKAPIKKSKVTPSKVKKEAVVEKVVIEEEEEEEEEEEIELDMDDDDLVVEIQ